MPKIYVNYIYNKKKDTYKLCPTDVVYVDAPTAVMEKNEEYDEVLVVPVKGVPTVVDKETFLEFHKAFYLSANGENIVEDEEHGIKMYLPKDTDISKLRYINNQIVLLDGEREENN